jgi:RND family efflux transporter MFP subunit
MSRLAVLAFLLLALLSGCGQDSTATAAAGKNSAPKPRDVRVVPALEARVPRTVAVTGALAADDQIVLSLKVTGRLSELTVDLGSSVRGGQVVARLDPTDFKLRVEQAEAALHQARVRLGLTPRGTDDRVDAEQTALVRQARAVLDESRLNRDRTIKLVREGVLSQSELDRLDSSFTVAESEYQNAIEEVRNRQAVLLQRRSELAIARQQLAETTLYAPFDGAVRERRANIGEYLASGAPVAVMVRLHPLRLRVEVPEREARGIRVGLPARVTVEGDPNTYTGRVARLSPAFQEQSRTLIIEAEVENRQGRLRPGSFAKAEIQTSTDANVITVPSSAVVTFAGIQKVFTVKDGKAVEHSVVLGRSDADWVEITEGLQTNDQIIVNPGNIVSGQPVTTEQ